MTKNDDFQVGGNPNMLYDLRQTYAMHILTPILILIEQYRESNDFKKWYDKLTSSLYTNIYQKLTEEEREEYKGQNEKCIAILNQYPNAFAGRDTTDKNLFIVKQSIVTLEMWLKDKMESHGLFGKGSEFDWDEI